MNLDNVCDPVCDEQTKQLVAEMLTILKNKPLSYAKDVLRMVGNGIEATSVVTLSES